MPEAVSTDGPLLLRQRSLPDQCDLLAEQLAPHVKPGTMPRAALIAVGATIVNLSAIGTAVRALLAERDAATVRAKQAEARVRELTQTIADLRAGLGKPVVQWAVALDGTESSPLPEKLARRMAGGRGTTLLTRATYPNPPWAEVDATPHADPKRAVDEQGDGGG